MGKLKMFEAGIIAVVGAGVHFAAHELAKMYGLSAEGAVIFVTFVVFAIVLAALNYKR